MKNDIHLARVSVCYVCRSLIKVIREGLKFCPCNFPEEFKED